MTTRLSDMPNIGTTLEAKLQNAGITSGEELANLGSKESFLRIKPLYPDACVLHLYALEGAVRNMRWHNLPQETKDELKGFFESL